MMRGDQKKGESIHTLPGFSESSKIQLMQGPFL